jgi:hypothetical protein
MELFMNNEPPEDLKSKVKKCASTEAADIHTSVMS